MSETQAASPLEQLRVDLQDALNARGLNAFLTEPERATPPITFVAPSNPYIQLEGAAFGAVIVRHDVVLVAERGVNDVAASDLDERLVRALQAIPPEFAIEDASVGQIPLNGQIYLGARITVLNTVEIGLHDL